MISGSITLGSCVLWAYSDACSSQLVRMSCALPCWAKDEFKVIWMKDRSRRQGLQDGGDNCCDSDTNKKTRSKAENAKISVGSDQDDSS